MERRWVTAAEAAAILGVAVTEVYRLVNEGLLHGARREGDPRVVIDESAVHELARRR